MRELKFRVWFTEFASGKRTRVFIDIYKEGNGIGGVVDDDIIVEQYTGLKDKNGKEIYEGDIVGFYEYYLNEETGEDEPGALEPWGQVIYEDRKARFGVWGDSPYSDEEKHFFGLTEGLEVIGNIHENPERLP